MSLCHVNGIAILQLHKEYIAPFNISHKYMRHSLNSPGNALQPSRCAYFLENDVF